MRNETGILALLGIGVIVILKMQKSNSLANVTKNSLANVAKNSGVPSIAIGDYIHDPKISQPSGWIR